MNYLAAVSLLLIATPSIADVIELTPEADNTMYELTTGLTSNGAGDYIFSGVTQNGRVRRALLQFDVDGLIPAGSTINSVSLRLRMSMTIAGNQNLRLHRATNSWGEAGSDASGEEGGGALSLPGDATWIHRSFPDVFWSSFGGDFSGSSSASTTVGGDGAYIWSSGALAGDVQDMLDNPGGNFGWVLKHANEGPFQTAKRFNSRENSQVSTRPTLVVDYTPGSCTDSNFCSSTANSTGSAALITRSGSCSVAANSFTLLASPVPNSVGIFFYSLGQTGGGAGTPFGNGLRCVGNGSNQIVRLKPKIASGNLLSDALDFTMLPANGQISPGSTWNFQAWFRDVPGGGAQFDLSDGLQVTFQ
jgi:hypothetical protein